MPTAAHVLAPPAAAAGHAARPSRYGTAWLLAAVYVAISSATRIVLTARALAGAQIDPLEVPRIMAMGLAYDLATALYLVAPFMVYLLLLPQRLYRLRAHRLLTWACMALALFGLTYLVAVEFFFFDEFNARFNFVAVEYLVYPHEVFVNIWQSYPVARALLASAAASAILLWVGRYHIAQALDSSAPVGQRLPPALLACGALLIVHSALGIGTGQGSGNRVADELAANGIYSFFSAASNAHLDYPQYYATINESEAAARVRRLVAQNNTSFLAGARNPLARHVHYPGAAKPLNVIVLLEESLGAEFIGAYGAERSLTPSLDRIAAESLVFTNAYATGTRTVRGMEAVTASFPPVPAESIVKRPGNEGMFNWSGIMRENGYGVTFIYGGYGTFDNMNHYFGSNGYEVVDRTSMDTPRFSNIWGVSDEDLFRNALRVFDAQHARGERIFSVVMTTSNHKPFTFPAGIAGVKPKGGGREAGVRYADHAIGYFVEQLKMRRYFDDTLVVIVADHGARVYGREDIPLPTYAIPFIVYSPRHVAARRVDTLTSQIDVAPTVLGLLNLSHDSVFFGKDVLADPRAPHFAPLNHNRDVALYRGGQLDGLGFRSTYSTLAYDAQTRRQTPIAPDIEGARDATSVFQLAYSLYARRGYRLE